MADVFDCANFFIEIANSNEDFDMTNMKLNKLLYYAQGAYLARYGKALFSETIQAWQHGPVVPKVYFKYNHCEGNPISEVDSNYTAEAFSGDELMTLVDVMREYGKYTASTLRNLTHEAGTPWTSVYVDGKKETISKSILKQYFTKHPVNSFKISGKIPVTRKLPKELYDSEEDAVWESYRKIGTLHPVDIIGIQNRLW